VNKVVPPGHQLMVLITSSARFTIDYRAATVAVLRGGSDASAVWLPIVR